MDLRSVGLTWEIFCLGFWFAAVYLYCLRMVEFLPFGNVLAIVAGLFGLYWITTNGLDNIN